VTKTNNIQYFSLTSATMKTATSIFVESLLILLITAHRLPAPIVEKEKPTPVPAVEQSEAPKRKHHSTRSTSTEQSPTRTKTKATPQPARNQPTPNPRPFAGTWDAKTGFPIGVTLIISPAQDSAVVKGLPIWGDRAGRSTANGNTLSWTFLAEKWNMVIAPDGKTAVVTDHGWPSGVTSGTFVKLP
jgi:hypothetical protein